MSVYNDHTYRKRRAALERLTKQNNGKCVYCGHHFDWTLHYQHPMAFTADHTKSLKQGGKLLGDLKPMHRSCNSRKNGDNRPPKITQPEGAGFW